MAITKNPRILGSKLALVIDSVDFWADVASFELAPESKDSDVVTFADAASGSSQKWKLKIKAIISTESGSFWSKVWDSAGRTVDFIVAPHANKTAAAGKPHFKGKVKIGGKPPISSEAGDEKGATFEVEWDVDGEPEKVETGSTISATGSYESE